MRIYLNIKAINHNNKKRIIQYGSTILQTSSLKQLWFPMNIKIKIKSIESMKDFPSIILGIIDVVIDFAVRLPNISGRFHYFFNINSRTSKLETTQCDIFLPNSPKISQIDENVPKWLQKSFYIAFYSANLQDYFHKKT